VARTRNARRATLLCAVAAITLAGCSDRAALEVRGVILISLDTLRADHLGCYGDTRGLTPALDALAATATRYAAARAASPWTLPSHATMFTGLYPLEHGAHTWPVDLPAGGRGANAHSALVRGQIAPLPEDLPVVAEVFEAAGWRTGAVVANAAYLSPKLGFQRGFEHYDVARDRGPGVNRRALAWLDTLEEDERFFLFLNYTDAHVPYNGTPRPQRFPEHVTRDSDAVYQELYGPIVQGEGEADADRLALLRRQYALAVANLDASMGALFAELEDRGLAEQLALVITADHGEYLGEHDLLGHCKDVYEEVLAAPLIVHLAGQHEGRTEQQQISHVHVPGLLFAAAGLEAPAGFPAPRERRVVLGENYYSRLRDLEGPARERFDRVRRALWVGDMKFIHSSDGAHELYDLAADPREEHDLLVDDPELAADWEERLHGLLAELRAPGKRAAGPKLGDADFEELRALGYLGEGGD